MMRKRLAALAAEERLLNDICTPRQSIEHSGGDSRPDVVQIAPARDVMTPADIAAMAERIRVATGAERVVIRIENDDGTSFSIPSETQEGK